MINARGCGGLRRRVHLKTAGTTWLEELTGLVKSGGTGLEIAKEVYSEACAQPGALRAPYAAVIDIDPAQLRSSEQFTSAMRLDQKNPAFNQSSRQLLHVGFKIAAKMGDQYLEALETNEAIIAKHVTANPFERHIKPVFLGL
jgi:tagaturonate epimerase